MQSNYIYNRYKKSFFWTGWDPGFFILCPPITFFCGLLDLSLSNTGSQRIKSGSHEFLLSGCLYLSKIITNFYWKTIYALHNVILSYIFSFLIQWCRYYLYSYMMKLRLFTVHISWDLKSVLITRPCSFKFQRSETSLTQYLETKHKRSEPGLSVDINHFYK